MIPRGIRPSILQGEVREVLRRLPEESIHCVVTSPPYWGLRDYGIPPVLWGGDEACVHDGRPFRNGESAHRRMCGTMVRFKPVIAEPTSSSRQRVRVPGAEAGSANWASNRILTSSSTTSPLSSTRSAGSSAPMGHFGSTSAIRTTPTAPCGDPPVRSSPASGILPLPEAEEGTDAQRAGSGT